MLTFKIDGMTCGHCVRAVTKAVQAGDAAAVVEIDLPTGRAKIHTKQDAEAVAASIREEGYAVALQPAS